MSDKKLQTIQNRKKALTKKDVSQRQKQYVERQARLQSLVEEHGLDYVAAAADLSVNTLRQYVRTSIAPSIAEDAVSKAEVVLEGL